MLNELYNLYCATNNYGVRVILWTEIVKLQNQI